VPTEEWEIARSVLDTRLLRVQAPVHALQFAPVKPEQAEGSHVITCVMGDKQIRRYKIRSGDLEPAAAARAAGDTFVGAESAATGAHQKQGTVVMMSPDGRHVATGGRDGDVILTACSDMQEVRASRALSGISISSPLEVRRLGLRQ
jgi:hypothetical protein